MKTVDASGLNESVLKEIDRLNVTIENNITSENFKYISYSAIASFEDSVALQKGANDLNIERLDPAWDYNANVNSMEISRIESAIQYMKNFKTKTIVQNFEFNPYFGMKDNYVTDKSDVKYKHIIKVPDNFDGRNSFVEYSIGAFLNVSEAQDTNKKFKDATAFWKPEDFACAWGNQQTGSNAKRTMVQVKIYRNKNEIILDVRFPKAEVVSGSGETVLDDQYIIISGRATMWRFL